MGLLSISLNVFLFLAFRNVGGFFDRGQERPEGVARDLGSADGDLLRGPRRILPDQVVRTAVGRAALLVTVAVHHRVHIRVFHRLRPRAVGVDGRDIFSGGT